jgi:AcrR family transcriptional regulator
MPYRQTDRTRERLAARHGAILGAARAIASEHGMAAVQIASVAEGAGIAAGTVYRYFRSKAELVEALVGAVAAAELEALRTAADAAPGPLSGLAAAVVTFSARSLRQRQLVWAVMAEPIEAEGGRARLAFRAALRDEMRSRVAAAVATNQLADTDSDLAATALVGALLEALIGPLAANVRHDPSAQREAVQMVGLIALRAVGLADAHARGLIVQARWP